MNIGSLANEYAGLTVGFHTAQQIPAHTPVEEGEAQPGEGREKQICAGHSPPCASSSAPFHRPPAQPGALSFTSHTEKHPFWKKPASSVARPALELRRQCEK